MLTGIDYRKKEVGVIDQFIPTGNFIKDMNFIQNKFKSLTPKYSKNYNINIF